MTKNITLVLFLTVFSACNLIGSSDKYTIEGTVKNFPTAKTVMIEKLGLKAITAVDSAVIGEKGDFKMEGVSEKGFYRMKLDEKTFWLFLLEPTKFNVQIDMTKSEDAFKITGSEENDEFQKAFKGLTAIQQELQMAQYTYMYMQQSGASQDSLSAIGAQLEVGAKKMENICKDGAKTAKSPLVAMFYVTNLPLQNYAKENLEILKRLEKEIPTSSYTKDFRATYTQYEEQMKDAAQGPVKQEPVTVGSLAPEIALNTPEGKTIALSSLRGKVVLIDFWASWCGPCRNEMPNVVQAYNKFKNKGFTVYSVSLDKDGEAWKKSIKALGMPWENQVSDLKFWNCEAAVRYGVNGIPATFLVDKQGTIIATNLRGAALESKLAEVLN
jgi:peroxiredoxin